MRATLLEAVLDALRLCAVVAEAVGRRGLEGEECWRAAARVRLALAQARSAPVATAPTPAGRPPTLAWLGDPDAAWLAGVNEYEGVWMRRPPAIACREALRP